ncbi:MULTISPECIES: XkdW family protein [Paenibacillus]|jgi:hypothetical protein|uniref:Bacteriophage SP-beta YorD domain-containing protein n=1 Tax=Paenibacillus odorifer TaxID=189426 RepID=A0ABX3GI01_9BACL|nr:XkdW family protein [Paenibacillus odorifer]OMC74069.1 hypothetical protein BK125_22110 [Paenibacillus odorifer]OMD06721.1 hypothetical protein BSO21_30605 [Paenibacillus odorifer]
MDLMKNLLFLFPDSQLGVDFTLRDDGPIVNYLKEPLLTKHIQTPGETTEEADWIEGVHYILRPAHLAELEEGVDYEIEERGPYIAAWNLDVPQPTEEELEAAWEAYLEAEANKPPELSEFEQLRAENTTLQDRLQDVEVIMAELLSI